MKQTSLAKFFALGLLILSYSAIHSQDCDSLSYIFAIPNLEKPKLYSLGQDLFSGRDKVDMSSEDRLCLIFEIENRLMEGFHYEEVVALGRLFHMLIELEAPVDSMDALSHYEMLSKAYSELGAADSCVFFADKAEQYLDLEEVEDLARLLKVRQPKLMGYIDMLQFEQAEEMLTESLSAVEATGVARPEWSRVYYDWGVYYNYFEELDESLAYFEKSVSLVEPYKAHFPKLYAQSKASYGKFLAIVGQYEKSKRTLEYTLEFSENQDQSKGKILCYSNLSELYAYMGDAALSEQMLDQAISIAKEDRSSPSLLSKLYLFKAANYIDLSKEAMALNSLEDALATLKSWDPNFRYNTLFGVISEIKANVAHQYFIEEGDSTLLKTMAKGALDNYDNLKFYSLVSNLRSRRLIAPGYESDAIETLFLSLDHADSIFPNNEKISLLFDLFEFSKAQQLNFVEHYIDLDLAEKRERMYPFGNLKLDIFFPGEKDQLSNTIEDISPYEIVSNLRMHDLDGKRKSFEVYLSDKEINAINYFIGDTITRVLYFNTDSLEYSTINISRDLIIDKANKFHSLISTPPNLNFENSFTEFKKLATWFDSIFVLPFHDNESDLLIVPDYPLTMIPFGSLIRNNSNVEFRGEGSWDQEYLIKQFNVHYAYSYGSYKYQNMKEGFDPDVEIISIAPKFSGEKFLIEGETRKIGNLKYNIKESNSGIKHFRGDQYVGSAANESAFENSQSSLILHLSTHTVFEEFDDYPKIVLSASGTSDSSYVFYDLTIPFENGFNSQIVLLSACNTSLGSYELGDGIISIPQALMANGIPSVVSTLWSVNDYSTAEIVGNFFENLREGI
ncbi:MAG: CHAT domain-containing protein, partial [Saprospiraceae bacterium]|nr:CHAT domain-containing protein [Saprospiraceae bacterium]